MHKYKCNDSDSDSKNCFFCWLLNQMATFHKPNPAGGRGAKKKNKIVPPPVITDNNNHSRSISHDIPKNGIPKYKRKGVSPPGSPSWRFQRNGPPQKSLPKPKLAVRHSDPTNNNNDNNSSKPKLISTTIESVRNGNDDSLQQSATKYTMHRKQSSDDGGAPPLKMSYTSPSVEDNTNTVPFISLYLSLSLSFVFCEFAIIHYDICLTGPIK